MRYKIFIVVYLVLWLLGISGPLFAQELASGIFQPSSLVSSEIARKQLQKIYLTSGKRRTFHCGCVFDKLKQVFPNLCEGSSPKQSGRGDPKMLSWISLMPPNVFAQSLKCWNKALCKRANGEQVQEAQCCSEISPKFKTMESDMHNIFPMVENPQPVDPASENSFAGIWEYNYCKRELEGTLRKEVRGDSSRAYLYMSFQYKIPLMENLENSLRIWHFEDPPDQWEVNRNDMIEVIQGNRNPFIDQPELVERVADF